MFKEWSFHVFVHFCGLGLIGTLFVVLVGGFVDKQWVLPWYMYFALPITAVIIGSLSFVMNEKI